MRLSNLGTATLLMAAAVLGNSVAHAADPAIPPAITTPDRVDSRVGTLEFKDGAPSDATLTRIIEQIDFTHACNAMPTTRS